MIRAEEKFSVTKKGGKYLLSTRRGDKFEVLGTSFDLGVSVGGRNEYKFIMLELPADAHNELIIVYVQGSPEWNPAFIMVDARKEQPFNLEEFIFLPEVNATYNFLGKYIEVRINDFLYTSDPENKNSEKKYVSCNTLCRYLVKKATEEDVAAEAEEAVEEKNAIAELAELKKKIAALEEKQQTTYKEMVRRGDTLSVIETERESLMRDLAKAKDLINELLGEKKSLEKSRKELNGIAHKLNDSSIFALIRRNKRLVTDNIVNAYNG